MKQHCVRSCLSVDSTLDFLDWATVKLSCKNFRALSKYKLDGEGLFDVFLVGSTWFLSYCFIFNGFCVVLWFRRAISCGYWRHRCRYIRNASQFLIISGRHTHPILKNNVLLLRHGHKQLVDDGASVIVENVSLSLRHLTCLCYVEHQYWRGSRFC